MRLNSMGRFCQLLLLGTLASFLFGCGGSAGGDASQSASVKGDATHGKELYTVCTGCHKPAENSVGPMHCNLFGRTSGTVPDYDYSEAMKASAIVWSPQKLDEFLTSPIAYVSGTKMGFAGFESATDRADVIAYLQQMNNDPAVCPKK